MEIYEVHFPNLDTICKLTRFICKSTRFLTQNAPKSRLFVNSRGSYRLKPKNTILGRNLRIYKVLFLVKLQNSRFYAFRSCFASKSRFSSLISGVSYVGYSSGRCPNRYAHSGQSEIWQILTSFACPQQHSRHFNLIAFIGVILLIIIPPKTLSDLDVNPCKCLVQQSRLLIRRFSVYFIRKPLQFFDYMPKNILFIEIS